MTGTRTFLPAAGAQPTAVITATRTPTPTVTTAPAATPVPTAVLTTTAHDAADRPP